MCATCVEESQALINGFDCAVLSSTQETTDNEARVALAILLAQFGACQLMDMLDEVRATQTG